MEIWKDVVGYEKYFLVSNKGRLFSKRTNIILKQHEHKHGYLHVASKIGGRKGKNICFKMHRVVAEAFIKNPENKPTVNHKDGIKTNNEDINLEWSTSSENNKHAYMVGLRKPTNMTDKRKLSNSDVLFIRNNLKISSRKLAKIFNVNKTNILKIRNYKTYKDVN